MRKTRTVMAALAAGLMTLSGLSAISGPASAAPQQHHNAPQQQQRGGNDHNTGAGQYGTWNTGWGARPPAPPRSFSRHNDWYRHVRACSQRYRSYNPATDRYTVRRGQTAVCTL